MSSSICSWRKLILSTGKFYFILNTPFYLFFSRSFLDRLYAVADLLTDRPEPKPPDSENPTSQPPMVGLVSLGRICTPGAPTWTKKWTFEHFVKRRRRKLWLSFSPAVLRFHFWLFQCLLYPSYAYWRLVLEIKIKTFNLCCFSLFYPFLRQEVLNK